MVSNFKGVVEGKHRGVRTCTAHIPSHTQNERAHSVNVLVCIGSWATWSWNNKKKKKTVTIYERDEQRHFGWKWAYLPFSDGASATNRVGAPANQFHLCKPTSAKHPFPVLINGGRGFGKGDRLQFELERLQPYEVWEKICVCDI